MVKNSRYIELTTEHRLGKARGSIFKLFKSPGIDSASLCSLTARYDNTIPLSNRNNRTVLLSHKLYIAK